MIDFVLNSSSCEDIVPRVAGEHKCPPSHRWGPHIRDHFIIHFCISGKGVLKREDGEHKVSAGELFIIREGEETTYTADKTDPWHYVWLAFVGKEAEVFRGGDAVRRAPISLTDRLIALISERERDPYAYASVIYQLIHELYSRKECEDRLSEIESHIRFNYMEDVTVASVSRSFGYERTYLYRIFKKRYGVSPKSYITRLRMERASVLLRAGYSVKNTACMVGYRDEFNFSKAYKRHFGLPPKSASGKKS